MIKTLLSVAWASLLVLSILCMVQYVIEWTDGENPGFWWILPFTAWAMWMYRLLDRRDLDG